MKIELGDKVKCIHTGFTGVAIAKTEFINGCVQFMVAPRVTKDNKFPDDVGIDEGSLQIVTKKKKPKSVDSGGPSKKIPKMRGY